VLVDDFLGERKVPLLERRRDRAMRRRRPAAVLARADEIVEAQRADAA
jgi:hypothetical protein